MKILVSPQDEQILESHTWSIDSKGYPTTGINYKTVRLHRLILGPCLPGFETDHFNGNKLDNRRENISIVPASQNRRNHKPKIKGNTSGINAVYFSKHTGKWAAQITIKHKTIHLGLFSDKRLAGLNRAEAEVKYWGVFVQACSWCGVVISRNFKIAPALSHGICPDCEAEIEIQMNNNKPAEDKPAGIPMRNMRDLDRLMGW